MSFVKRSRWLLLSTVVVAVTAVILLATVRNTGATSGQSLNASSFSILQDDASRVAGVPSATTILGEEYAPAPGTAHVIADGFYAWTYEGRACWSAFHSAGCIGKDIHSPVGITIGYLDEAKTVAVYGLAADGVTSVEVELRNGVKKTAEVVNNAYSVDVGDISPSDLSLLRAHFGDGGISVEKFEFPEKLDRPVEGR